MTLVAVTDTETTGLANNDQVCEIGIALLDVREIEVQSENDYSSAATYRREVMIKELWTSFVKPTCSMSIGAQATHHITHEELDGAPTMTELLLTRGFPEWGKMSFEFSTTEVSKRYAGINWPDVVFAAHNAKFDRQMLEQSGVHPDILPRRTICTYKCARHLFPNSSQFKNQTLRYELGLDPLFHVLGVPHRALPDVAVTAAILARMLETHSVEQLVHLTTQPILIDKWAFGQGANRGKRYRDFDESMLRWILGRDFGEDEKFTAQYWLDVKAGRRQHRD